jgi:glycosyltransferase involved in cell wall biosynthesis
VYDCHELTPIVYAQWYGSSVGRIARVFEKIFLRFVNQTITAVPYIRDYLFSISSSNSERDAIRVVYNTVRPSDLPSLDKAACRDKLNLSGFVVTFVGSMIGVYALDELVEAAGMFGKLASRITFVIVGGGGFEFERLKRQVASHDSDQLVRLVPQVSNQEALTYIKASDVLFALARNLDFNVRIALPWKMFEAMACGTPIAVRDNTLLWRFVQERGIGFSSHSSDAIEIFDKLKWAMSHPDELRLMSARAKEVYNQSFNWEITSFRLMEVYASI